MTVRRSEPDGAPHARDDVWHVRGIRCLASLASHYRATEATDEGGLPIMDNVIPSLYASTPEPLGFGPSLEIRAFLLQRERGNLLLYRSEMLKRDVEELNALGGVSRQYLNHHHEASPAC